MCVKLGLLLLIGSVLAVSSGENHISYDGFKVYKIETKTANDNEYFHSMSYKSGFDFWQLSKIVGADVHVMVEPQQQKQFEMDLKIRQMKYEILMENVERTFQMERLNQRMVTKNQKDIGWTRYYRFDEINEYLDELAQKYPNLVTVKSVGKSHEGRTIKTISISDKTSTAPKKIIFMDAGIHAREWIAPATALYVINQLVEKYENNKDVLKNIDWVILPVINPDGYEYTHTRERLWRKTRKPNPNSVCAGTDGNRNFDLYWATVGSSSSFCAETFHGANPFSEPETIIVRDIMEEVKKTCKFYLTIHSYGNYMLYPWGYTSALPENWKDHHEVGKTGADAIYNATGSRYTVGSSTNVLYAAAGGSDDYAYGVKNIPISITMELPGGGSSGFDPPASKIDPFVKESWIGIRAMALRVDNMFS